MSKTTNIRQVKPKFDQCMNMPQTATTTSEEKTNLADFRGRA
jgi:hypothetical protein